MESIEEKIEIKGEVRAIPINSKYGQPHVEKTIKDSRSVLCKNCHHSGTQHKFPIGYNEGNHNCYLCDCPNYIQ